MFAGWGRPASIHFKKATSSFIVMPFDGWFGVYCKQIYLPPPENRKLLKIRSDMQQFHSLVSSLLNSKEFLSAVLGAIIGGLIAGTFTLLGQRQSNKAQRKRDGQAEYERVKGTLQALWAELDTFKKRFVDAFKKRFVEPNSEVPYAHIPKFAALRHSFFIVFDSNADLIGHITSAELRREIVSTYVKLKAAVDTLNHYAERRANWDKLCFEGGFGREYALEEAENWAANIRNSLPGLENDIAMLLEHIRAYLEEETSRSKPATGRRKRKKSILWIVFL